MHRAGFTLSCGLKNPLSPHSPRGSLQLAQLLITTGESLGTMSSCLWVEKHELSVSGNMHRCCSCGCTCERFFLSFLLPQGVEHHLSQLVDFRVTDLVLHLVDDSGPEEIRHAQLSLHGLLWKLTANAAVYMEYRAQEWWTSSSIWVSRKKGTRGAGIQGRCYKQLRFICGINTLW